MEVERPGERGREQAMPTGRSLVVTVRDTHARVKRVGIGTDCVSLTLAADSCRWKGFFFFSVALLEANIYISI